MPHLHRGEIGFSAAGGRIILNTFHAKCAKRNSLSPQRLPAALPTDLALPKRLREGNAQPGFAKFPFAAFA